MSDNELEELKKRKLMELQRQQESQLAMQEQHAAFEAQKKAALRQILTPEAKERLARVAIARPEIAESVEEQLIGLAQSGRLARQIDDETLKQILEKVTPKKREIKITRR